MNKIIHYTLIISIFLLLINNCGCASIHARKTYRYPEIYPSIQGFLGYSTISDLHSQGWPLPFLLIIGIISIIDLPFSFTLDTICLPYDIYRVNKEKSSKVKKNNEDYKRDRD